MKPEHTRGHAVRRTPRLWRPRRGAVTVGVALAMSLAFGASLALASGYLATAAAAAGRHAKASTKPVLRLGLSFAPVSDDPALAGSGPVLQLLDLDYAPIIQETPSGSLVPGLATSWRYLKSKSGPNTRFEFKLRENVRFSNGQRLTPRAVVAWLNHMVNAHGTTSTMLGANPQFRSIGKWTVQISLKAPDPAIPLTLSEQYNWGDVVAPQATANPKLLTGASYGAGPYMIEPSQTVTAAHYTLVPNPYYYDKAAIKYREIDVTVISNPSSMLEALQTGQIDAGSGLVSTANAAASAGIRVVTSLPRVVEWIGLFDRSGTVVKALSDVRVRQALNYAINRSTVTKALFGSDGIPTSTMLTSDLSAKARKALDDYYPYDPAKARSLLQAAGYPNGFTLPILTFGSTGLTNAEAIAKYLEAVGVKVETTNAPTPAQALQDLATRKYPAFTNTTAIAPMEITDYPDFFASNGTYNPFGMNDPVINQLYNAGLRSADPSADFTKIVERATHQADFIPFATVGSVYYVTKAVAGVPASGFVLPSYWRPASK